MIRLRAASSQVPTLAVHAGLVPYARASAWQRRLAARRAEDAVPDVVLSLEHPKVFTAGKTADLSHVLWDAAERAARGVELHAVERGGDVTYHGPGQLVGYPILRLDTSKGVVGYVRALEEICIRTAGDYGVTAERVPGYTGVWVGDRKLVAIGVRVSGRGVTSHGFAFNVTTDLDDFAGIVPCGIEGRGVCSLASLGVETTVDDVRRRLLGHLADVLGCTVEDADLVDLERLLAEDSPRRTIAT